MRGLLALGLVALAGGLAAGSQYLIRLDAAFYMPYVVFFWLVVAGFALTGLLWLYFQIALGPRATVAESKAQKLERALADVRAGKGWFAAVVVRLGMHEDWREKAAREAAEGMKARLARLAGG